MYFCVQDGKTRKTYLWKVIIVAHRSKGKIILLVASSGIVVLLLSFGKTAHAIFKIPVILTEATYSSFLKHSKLVDFTW